LLRSGLASPPVSEQSSHFISVPERQVSGLLPRQQRKVRPPRVLPPLRKIDSKTEAALRGSFVGGLITR
jgi:hypothetical protein